MIRKITMAAGTCFLLGSSPNAFPVDSLAVEIGHGDDHTSLLRVAIVNRWRNAQRPPAPEWRLAGYWEFSAGLWDNPDESTADVGVTPVFRMEREALYVEGAIGAHLVQARISAHRSFSTALQFAEHVGAGFYMGKYDLGMRVQHLSNGGFRSPNPGINFLLVRLQYALD